MHTNTLTEIKKGQTGTGLLIEQDGYVSLDIKNNRQLTESVVNEDGIRELPRPFVVHAVFQKYGIENSNGRIYPEDILKREVEKYQQKIKMRNSIGECYTPDVEILSETGWVKLCDVKEGDNVFTLNVGTMLAELKPVLKKISYEYEGEMIRIKGDGFDDFVTPNHKFPLFNSDGVFDGFYKAEDFLDNDKTEKLHVLGRNRVDGYDNFTLTKEGYKGVVECIEVENHTWLVRSNGNEHWTGNCNHPDDSNINLERTSMLITELHWEGRTLVGQIEIPITEGYRKYGIISCLADHIAHLILNNILIGVSSRALGTVKKVGNVLVVDDSLEILCWDYVSTPSTPNAWISTNYEDLEPFKESEKKDDSKLINEDKYSKFDAWLND